MYVHVCIGQLSAFLVNVYSGFFLSLIKSDINDVFKRDRLSGSENIGWVLPF